MQNLTENQAEFISNLVREGCNPTEAARRAGYAHPKQRAHELLRKPHVAEAIRQEQSRLIGSDLANVALRTLKSIMETDDSPPSARVAASRAVLEAGGYFKKDGNSSNSFGKPIDDMSPDELDDFIREGQKMIGTISQSGNA